MSATTQATTQPSTPPSAEASPDAPAAPRIVTVGGRRPSVDVLRGTVLATMLLTPPIAAEGVNPMYRHARWDGATLSDLILPLFLFASGVSLSLLLARRFTAETWRRVVRRLLALLLLGVLYNAVGTSLVPGELRFTGVLQTIGAAGFLVTLVVAVCRAATGGRDRPGVLGGVLAVAGAVYTWTLMTRDCWRTEVACGPFHAADVDLFGARHLYRGGEPGYDPEGTAAVLGLSLVVLAGYLAGVLVVRRTSAWTLLSGALVGVAAIVVAVQSADVVPVVKRVASPTFLLLAAGIGIVVLVVLVCLLDLGPVPEPVELGRRRLAWPLATLGANALVVYLGERLVVVAFEASGDAGASMAVTWLLGGNPATRAGLAGVGLLALFVLVTSVMRALHWRVAL